MATRPEESHPQGCSEAERVANEFTRLYYHILNDNPEYLHQFYAPSSAVTVSETQDDGSNLNAKANSLEVIKGLTLQLFGDVRVSLTNMTVQSSIRGGIQIMVSGVMHQKRCDGERLFTQALFLAKQDQGYFVLNDTVHVHSRISSWKVLNFRESGEEMTPLLPAGDQQEGEKEPVHEPEPEPEQAITPPETAEEELVADQVEQPVAQSHQMHVEDEAVGPPTSQNVAPIEKPATAQPTNRASSPSAKRSYRDALKRQAALSK